MISTLCDRIARVVVLVALTAGSLTSAGGARAQEATPAPVSGNTYTSPTFGYTFSWDDAVWTASDAYSEEGYDTVTLTADASNLYVEGMYFYRGDPGACLTGERLRNAEGSGVDDLEAVTDENGDAMEGTSDGVSYGFYDYTETGDDGSQTDWILYIECRPLIEHAAVLVLTAFLPPDDIANQADTIQAVIDTIATDGVPSHAFTPSDLDQAARDAVDAVDAYWADIFTQHGVTYEDPGVVSFADPVETGCTPGLPGESGPFYCPADQTVYIDLVMMDQEVLPVGIVMVDVVIAHEIGHHIQNLLGLEGCDAPECGEPGNSLAIELQADCLAGAWTKEAVAEGVFSKSEIKRVDTAVKDFFGDPPDTPADDPGAHGSGEARDEMFQAGFKEGLDACNFPQ